MKESASSSTVSNTSCNSLESLDHMRASQTQITKQNWLTETIDGLTLMFSPLLKEQQKLTHAFTTRLGGASRAPLESFNLGRHIEDDADRKDAMVNRERLCKALSLEFKNLVVPGQVHSNNVTWLTSIDETPDIKAVDGIATRIEEQPMLLHFADCVPVILVARKQRLACIMHAGWRGTASAIVLQGVKLLVSHGADTNEMVAAVGPAIETCCYPTSEDVAQQLLSTVKDTNGLVDRNSEQPRPDLKAINARQLLEAGVDKVDVSNLCTACNPQIFYSHRQSGGKTGRQGALVCLRA